MTSYLQSECSYQYVQTTPGLGSLERNVGQVRVRNNPPCLRHELVDAKGDALPPAEHRHAVA